MQVRRFDLAGASDYSKMGKKNTHGKITYYDSDSDSTAACNQGQYNDGLSQTPITSDTDLTNIVLSESKGDIEEMDGFYDSELVHMPSLGLRYSKSKLKTALEEYYNTKVEIKRFRFHQEMSEIERKVNDVLSTVHTMEANLCFQRMQPSCFYEIRGPNEIDVFLICKEAFDWSEFYVEEVLDLEGCARIRRRNTSVESHNALITAVSSPTWGGLGTYCVKSKSGPVHLSAKAIGSHFKDLVRRSFECLPREWRDSWPECKLNSQVHQVAGTALERTNSFQEYFRFKRVSFQDKQRYIVNLIPTIACPKYWPHSSKWSQSSPLIWPDRALLNHIKEQGVHLVAMPTDKDHEDAWKIKFFYGQRLLNNHTTAKCKQKCLRIVKVLCENELRCSMYFAPFYLENMALQLHEQNPHDSDWADDMLPIRFLEFLEKIYHALKSRKCVHYFMPHINLLSHIPERFASRLARNVFHILNDPLKYLI